MKTIKLMLLLLAMLSASCASTGTGNPATPPAEVRIVDTACDWTRPIYIATGDTLTDPTARAILAHNQAGAHICGWKPRTQTK